MIIYIPVYCGVPVVDNDLRYLTVIEHDLLKIIGSIECLDVIVEQGVDKIERVLGCCQIITILADEFQLSTMSTN